MSALLISCKYTETHGRIDYDAKTFSSRAHGGMKSQSKVNTKMHNKMIIVVGKEWHKALSFDNGVIVEACLEGGVVSLRMTGNGEPVACEVMPSNLPHRLTRILRDRDFGFAWTSDIESGFQIDRFRRYNNLESAKLTKIHKGYRELIKILPREEMIRLAMLALR